MKSKKLYCSELCKHVFSIFSVVTVIYGLLVFLSYPLYTILGVGEELEDIVFNPFLIGLTVTIPIFLGLIFNYLYNTKSVNRIHSMPYTRTQIYVNYLLAGFAILIIPYISNGIILVILRAINPKLIELTMNQILYTLGIYVLMNLVLFSFSSLIAVLVSSSFMHVGLTYWILLIPSLLIMIIGEGILPQVIYGFPGIYGDFIENVMRLSPIFFPINLSYMEDYTYEGAILIYYCVFALVSIIMSIVGYNRRKLENTNEWVAFNFVKVVVKVSVAAVGSIFLGGFFIAIENGASVSTLIWFILGGAIGYIIAAMFLDKRINVLSQWKGLTAYLAFVIIIYAVVGFDMTGYITRVPDSTKVSSVFIDSRILYDLDTYERIDITSDVSIDKTVKVHDTIIDYYKDNKLAVLEERNWDKRLSLKYILDNGNKLERQYYLPEELYLEIAQMLYGIDEVRESNLYGEFRYINTIELYSNKGNIYIDQDELEDFVQLLDKDFNNMNFEQRIKNSNRISVNVVYEDVYYKTEKVTYREINIGKHNQLVNEWLKEKGYFDQLVYSADEVTKVLLYDENRNVEKEVVDKQQIAAYLDEYMEYPKYDKDNAIEFYLNNGNVVYGYLNN